MAALQESRTATGLLQGCRAIAPQHCRTGPVRQKGCRAIASQESRTATALQRVGMTRRASSYRPGPSCRPSCPVCAACASRPCRPSSQRAAAAAPPAVRRVPPCARCGAGVCIRRCQNSRTTTTKRSGAGWSGLIRLRGQARRPWRAGGRSTGGNESQRGRRDTLRYDVRDSSAR